MRKLFSYILAISVVPILLSCSSRQDATLCSAEWYAGDSVAIASDIPSTSDADKTDIFYICSTNVLSSGLESHRAELTADDKAALRAEMDYARGMFGKEFNFFSPFYHQFTFESISLTKEEFQKTWTDVKTEILSLFRYYMKNMNGGRPFILAGFSQGAMAVLEILKDMDDDAYRQLVAAYMIGYRLSAADLQHPHIKAAEDADSRGVTISFNSVSTTADVWPVVSDSTATCINPINWTTSSTPAQLIYDGDTATVSADQEEHVLVVSGLDTAKYRFPMLEHITKKGNLHHWDLLFYRNSIRDNALLRAYGKR